MCVCLCNKSNATKMCTTVHVHMDTLHTYNLLLTTSMVFHCTPAIADHLRTLIWHVGTVCSAYHRPGESSQLLAATSSGHVLHNTQYSTTQALRHTRALPYTDNLIVNGSQRHMCFDNTPLARGSTTNYRPHTAPHHTNAQGQSLHYAQRTG